MLADSGSDENLVPAGYAPGAPVHAEDPKAPLICDARGNDLGMAGAKSIPYVLGEGSQVSSLPEMRVGERVTIPLFSFGKMARAGFRIVLDSENPHAFSKKDGRKVDMKLVGNSFYFPARVCESIKQAAALASENKSFAAPVEAEDEQTLAD